MAALFYLFFTDTEFTSQEKLFVFSSCGGNGAIAFVGFITENSWYHRLYNACQGIPTKIPLLFIVFADYFGKKSITIDRYPELHFSF
jgi:hypothetical protein